MSERHVTTGHMPRPAATDSMRTVWSCNEWDPLEEVILGTAKQARMPTGDRSTQFLLYPDRPVEAIPDGSFPQQVIDETEEDLAQFAEVLRSQGVTVHRPEPYDTATPYSTPHWTAHGFHSYCPRDVLAVIGDRLIESPGAMRSRFFETFAYRTLLVDYLRHGAQWVCAPRPRLLDSTYASLSPGERFPDNTEPVFDAANILRIGYDVLYQISCSGNHLGAQWLQALLGSAFTVHPVEGVYQGSHIDSTFAVLRPGLVLCNPERVASARIPPLFAGWDVLYSPPMVHTSFHRASDWLIGSEWIGMNVFSISPSVVVVDRDQAPLIALLECSGFTVIPLALRHARVLGGGFHCVTLDVRRRGTLERYA